MKVVFKVMSERQKEKEGVEEQEEEKGRDVFRINSEVRPMMDAIDDTGEEGRRKETKRGRRRKERRGRQREEVMRKEKQKEEEVKERRSEWRREEPLAKPSLTGGAVLEKAPFAPLLFLLAIIAATMPHLVSSTTV